MKNKKLIILFSILMFLTVLVVLSSTLFTLQTVSVKWYTEKNKMLDYKDYEITESVALGESIFLVQKDDITTSLEKKYPYMRVVGVETKFPNKIVLHVAERSGLYAIKKSDSNYAILDEYGKVLDDDFDNSTFVKMAESSLGGAPIEMKFTGLAIKDEDMVVGEIIKVEKVREFLSNLSLGFRKASHIPETSMGLFKYINVMHDNGEYMVSMQTRRGIVIEMSDGQVDTTEKLLLGIARYNEMRTAGDVEGVVKVFYSDKFGTNIAE
ncbi:MAG: FtsQ-type POTRA domain-containing protein [Clostridiales bacterium]|nr:FtsQ-type POTRA domain-containing protein [Clostridiales bacterium]